MHGKYYIYWKMIFFKEEKEQTIKPFKACSGGLLVAR